MLNVGISYSPWLFVFTLVATVKGIKVKMFTLINSIVPA